MDIEKKIAFLTDKLRYIEDIFNGKESEIIATLRSVLQKVIEVHENKLGRIEDAIEDAEQVFATMEARLDAKLSAMDKVRIVRHSQRVCLRDILENVYDNYTEIGGKDDCNIDPSVIIARAYIKQEKNDQIINQPVMVIGHEKGHGEEYRNGGSAKPFGNAKALQYMFVAQTEGIPIHTYVFTPGAYPIEDTPGAAQQIAKNLYEMAGLSVPIIAVFSEGGSGGAEAISLADKRCMLSHGYYSVISPEGAAAIEGKAKSGERVAPEIIEQCATALKMSAVDNKNMGYIDDIIQEPPLGARPFHYDFFKELRKTVIKATNEVVLSVRFLSSFRTRALQKAENLQDTEIFLTRWNLSSRERRKLLRLRYKKFRAMALHAFVDNRTTITRVQQFCMQRWWDMYSYFTYRILLAQKRKIAGMLKEVNAEVAVMGKGIVSPVKKILLPEHSSQKNTMQNNLLSLSQWDSSSNRKYWRYISDKAKEDRAVECPNVATHGCLDMWAKDLFGEFAGVCMYCGYHFPMEYQWYYYNIFDEQSILEFNQKIHAGNPLQFPKLDERLEKTRKDTGLNSSCITFEARIEGIKVVVAMLVAPFRGGSVGAAEGEKFIRAVELAKQKDQPFIAYVHGTAGIRVQEGVNGVIQMPRCTMAIRRYIDAGGLYLVIYDTNSYAGPLASFLGCSPYQFGIHSSNIGFAGRGVIKETTGLDIPPDYHSVNNALLRGHIQGIWDRRELRSNIKQALSTFGGQDLYYR